MASETPGLPLSAKDTALSETPARRAMSFIVGLRAGDRLPDTPAPIPSARHHHGTNALERLPVWSSLKRISDLRQDPAHNPLTCSHVQLMHLAEPNPLTPRGVPMQGLPRHNFPLTSS
ncbi:hypothetical protein GCM10010254_50440 [Streptomyces chromofuscus]|nr:hypothetical protein GCM10010254_50440 [Streptomyces chromofuscus]